MHLKLLNLNLWRGGKLLDNILNFIKQEQPDILHLQEVNQSETKTKQRYNSLPAILKVLPAYKSSYNPSLEINWKEGSLEFGNAILSRFPIKNTGYIFYNNSYASYDKPGENFDYSQFANHIQHAAVELPDGKVLNLFNTHGVWGKDGEDNKQRDRMSQVIVDYIKGKQNVILSGDFNTLPHTNAMKNISKYLVNIFQQEIESKRMITSFNLKRKNLIKGPGYATAVVDYVFVSQDIKVVSKKMPQVDVSDHLPIVCELEV